MLVTKEYVVIVVVKINRKRLFLNKVASKSFSSSVELKEGFKTAIFFGDSGT